MEAIKMNMLYTYPSGHPKEGKSTICYESLRKCPYCHYLTNLADDYKEHVQNCVNKKKGK